jgi:hypothetical protein
VALPPSCTGLIGISSTYGIIDSSTSDADPFITSVPRGTAFGHDGLEGTMAWSAMLPADGTTRGKCGDVTKHAVNHQKIRVVKV